VVNFRSLLGAIRAVVVSVDVFRTPHLMVTLHGCVRSPSILLQSCMTCTGGVRDWNDPAIADWTR